MGEGGKVKIKVESATSELYVELKETDGVQDLIEIVKMNWGDEYLTLHHHSTQMHPHHPLSAYNIKDGSVVKVNYYADSP
ncbi:UNVERIFIED_CONTAM: hypothetical protein Sindi_1369400 [Sesamum indicum]